MLDQEEVLPQLLLLPPPLVVLLQLLLPKRNQRRSQRRNPTRTWASDYSTKHISISYQILLQLCSTLAFLYLYFFLVMRASKFSGALGSSGLGSSRCEWDIRAKGISTKNMRKFQSTQGKALDPLFQKDGHFQVLLTSVSHYKLGGFGSRS